MSASPALPRPSFEQGLGLYRSGSYAEACEVLEAILEADPTDAEAWHVLSLSKRSLGRVEAAILDMEEVLRFQPNNAEAWSNYGAMLREKGRLSEAESALRSAIQLSPETALAWNNLGAIQLDLVQLDEARFSLERALALEPSCGEALANLSRVHYESGDMAMAKKTARFATAVAPDLAEAHNRLSIVQSTCGDVEESLKSLEVASRISPQNDLYASNLLLRSLSSDRFSRGDLKNRAVAWGKKYAGIPSRTQGPPRQIRRIGFLSGDLRSHPVGYFLLSLVQHLSKELELVAYHAGSCEDALTQELKPHFAAWRNVFRVSTEPVVDQMVADGLDVLIDLAGHTRDGRLDVMARHPASATLSWLGYSGTTGLPQMDGLIADSALVPLEHEDGYTERVLRLKDSFLCVTPSEFEPVCGEDRATFGVFNNPSKYSRSAFEAWFEILRQCEGTTLLFKYHNLHDPWIRSQVANRFEDVGIEASRIRFASTVSYQDHLQTVASVKVALDTFPYTGATTTLDCVTAGTPLVTLCGDHYASRMSSSLLSTMGRTDTVCESSLKYIQRAVQLVQDEDVHSFCQAGLRESFLASPLCDSERFASGFLDVLQGLAV